jgi:hypothetical protein
MPKKNSSPTYIQDITYYEQTKKAKLSLTMAHNPFHGIFPYSSVKKTII